MENYLMVNGKKIPLTEEQVAQITGNVQKPEPGVELATLKPGDIFRIGQCEFLVLEQMDGATAVIKRTFLEEAEFGESNNYAESPLRSTCQEFAEGIGQGIGMENILEHTVDLTANDGLEDFGEITARASMLTAERYRKYVKILDAEQPEDWWWLATPFSTTAHGIEYGVLCVSPSGCVSGSNFDYGYGVRPFCILKSTIFVSR